LGFGPKEDIVGCRVRVGRQDFLSGSCDEIGPEGEGVAVDFGDSEGDLGEGGSIGGLGLVMGREDGGEQRGLNV
jgi:hypothetical protein